MSGLPGETGLSGLKFFGTMTAAVSHDIKNVMAIINENAGLIKDLIQMSQKGAPLDAQRIHALADRCSRQVARADGIIKDLNRFSHSIDDPIKQVDLVEVMNLTLSLSTRFARLKGVVIELNPSPANISVTTNPFFLSLLLWLCMEYGLDTAGEDKKITIDIQKQGSDIRICFTGLGAEGHDPRKTLFAEPGKDIMRYLNADIKTDEANRMICIMLPTVLGNRNGQHSISNEQRA